MAAFLIAFVPLYVLSLLVARQRYARHFEREAAYGTLGTFVAMLLVSSAVIPAVIGGIVALIFG